MKSPVEMQLWQCPSCGRKYRIPASAADPKLCPECRKESQHNPKQKPKGPRPLEQTDKLIEVIDEPDEGNHSRLSRAGSVILTWLLVVYSLGVMFSIPSFNWKYANQHGFVDWFFLGGVIPTAQGIIWPYYAVAAMWTDSGESLEPPENVRKSVESHFRSIEYARSFRMLVNDPNKKALRQDIELALSLLDSAEIEANKVDPDVLNDIYDGWRDHFVNDMKPAIPLLQSALSELRRSDGARADAYIARWQMWYTEKRFKEIGQAVNEKYGADFK